MDDSSDVNLSSKKEAAEWREDAADSTLEERGVCHVMGCRAAKQRVVRARRSKNAKTSACVTKEQTRRPAARSASQDSGASRQDEEAPNSSCAATA
jgi:hypothetical protein